jgi:hypothetical protein
MYYGNINVKKVIWYNIGYILFGPIPKQIEKLVGSDRDQTI